MDKRYVFKMREVMQLLKTEKPATLHVCSYDKKRPEKSGKLLILRNVTLSSHRGFLEANMRHKNGETTSIKACLIEKYNGTKVMP